MYDLVASAPALVIISPNQLSAILPMSRRTASQVSRGGHVRNCGPLQKIKLRHYRDKYASCTKRAIRSISRSGWYVQLSICPLNRRMRPLCSKLRWKRENLSR